MGQSNVAGMTGVGVVAGAALICFSSVAHASAGDVRTWLAQAWEEAAKLPNFGDANLKWHAQRLYVPSDAQLETMRRAVAGKPDHPDRASLMLYDRRVRGDKDEAVRQLWCHGDGQWRLSYDFQSNNLSTGEVITSFSDTTVLPDRHWRITPDQLLIEPPDVSARSEIGGLIRSRSDFVLEVGYFANGGMTGAHQSGTALGEVVVNGNRWSVIATRTQSQAGKSYQLRFDGRWDEAQSRGFVERMEIVTNDYKPQVVGTAWTFSDWRVDAVSDKAFAWKVEEFRPGGILDSRFVIEHFAVEPGKSFEEVTRTPEVAGVDPVRGKVTFSTIQDLIKGVRTDVNTGSQAALGIQPRRVAPEVSKVNWLVWISSSCVVAGFGLAGVRRWKKRRSAAT